MYEILVIIVLIGLWVFGAYENKKRNKRYNIALKEFKKKRSSEEDFEKELIKFEKNILRDYVLPDSIHPHDAHIFRFFMIPFYRELSNKHRLDRSKLEEMRQLLLKYMDGIEKKARTRYFMREGKNSSITSEELEKLSALENMLVAIEDGLAAGCGHKFVKDLVNVRIILKEKPFKVNFCGDMAPKGKEYLGELLIDCRPQKVSVNYEVDFKLFLNAAEQGDAKAQFNIGNVYEWGDDDIRQDIVKAYKWYNLAATQGFTGATDAKELLEKKMTKQQIAEGQRLSREWFIEHQ